MGAGLSPDAHIGRLRLRRILSRWALWRSSPVLSLRVHIAMGVRVEVRDWPRRHNGSDGVFIDQLGRPPHRIEQNGESIKSADHSTELYAVYKIDRYPDVFFANLI
jgi:hypothetical protein